RPKDVCCDIKVPWEISRLHYLVTLGMAYKVSKDLSYVQRLKVELFDFIRENPPASALNWVYSMEVGIRIVNVVLALAVVGYECLRLSPRESIELKQFLGGSALYIFRNLEWRGGLRNNHYYISLLGLFVGASLFPGSRVFNNIMSFAAKEIHKETAFHIMDNGVGVEGSSSYHRLNVEMLLIFDCVSEQAPIRKYTALNALYLFYKFPRVQPDLLFRMRNKHDHEEYQGRLLKGVRFLEIISNWDGEYPLIGDNDSGRIIKIYPAVFCDGREGWSSISYLNGFFLGLNKKYKNYGYSHSDLLPVRCNGLCQEYHISHWNLVVLKSKLALAVVQLGMNDLPVKGHAHPHLARVDFFYDGSWSLRSGGSHSYNVDRNAYHDSKQASNILLAGRTISSLDFRKGSGECWSIVFDAAGVPVFEFSVSGTEIKFTAQQEFDELDMWYSGDYLSPPIRYPLIDFIL